MGYSFLSKLNGQLVLLAFLGVLSGMSGIALGAQATPSSENTDTGAQPPSITPAKAQINIERKALYQEHLKNQRLMREAQRQEWQRASSLSQEEKQKIKKRQSEERAQLKENWINKRLAWRERKQTLKAQSTPSAPLMR